MMNGLYVNLFEKTIYLFFLLLKGVFMVQPWTGRTRNR